MAALLRARTPALLEQWEQRLREDAAVPGANRAAGEELRVFVESFLARLTEALDACSEEARHGEELGRRILGPAASQGWGAHQIRALSHLRSALSELFAGAGLPFHGPGATLIHAALDASASALVSGLEQTRSLELAATQAALARVEAATVLKDEFLATVSHELRTPLNAMLGWLRILRTGELPLATQKRALEVVERNATLQAQLIDDLLDVSHILAGKLRLDLAQVDLAPLVAATVEVVRPAMEAKQLRFHAAVDPAAAPLVADPSRVQQVLWNLLSNAAKFTPAGGSIGLTVMQVGSMLELTVDDTGQGIAPEFLPHVFDHFKQADGTITRAHGGLGLGLAIVRHVVELHGGTVEALSAGKGRGATFVVRLPTAAGLSTEPPAVPLDCPPALRGLRVLVLDDDADTRNLLVAILEHCEVKPFAVGSVDEALALLVTVQPDLILSDIGMHGGDGYEFLKQVRALDDAWLRQIPAAALTAYTRPEDRRRVMHAGYQMHVPKPLEPAQVIAVVENLARIGSLLRQH